MATGRKGKKANKLQKVFTLNSLQRDLAKAKQNLEVAIAEKVQQKYITTFEMEVEQLEREINEHSTKGS